MHAFERWEIFGLPFVPSLGSLLVRDFENVLGRAMCGQIVKNVEHHVFCLSIFFAKLSC